MHNVHIDPMTENWRRHVHGPSGQVVEAVRIFRVRWSDAVPDISRADWHSGTEAAELPCGDGALLIDFGVKTTGHLLVECNGVQDFGMEVVSGPHIKLIKFERMLSYRSSAGMWRDDQFIAARYLKVRSTGARGARVRFKVEFTGWTGDFKGHFICSDELLNRIWYAGAYTIQICTQPHELSGSYNHLLPPQHGDFPNHWRSPYGRHVLWDAPRRDREVWIGDMWPECHGLLYAFYAPEVIKASLHAVAVHQREDGLIPGSGISLQTFAEYSCWWMALVDRLHLLTGDVAFILDMEATIRRLMGWLEAELDRYGGFLEIGHRQTWAWTLSRRGAVTGSQCVAVAALRGGSNALRLLGDAAFADRLACRAIQLEGKIRTELWNEDLGVFRDCLTPVDGTVRVSCDSNAMPAVFGIAGNDQVSRSLDYLKRVLWTPFGTRTILPVEPEDGMNWAHNHNIWPFVVGFELEARFVQGDHDNALTLLRSCWGNMIRHDSATFWEMVSGEDGDFVTHRRVADVQTPAWDSWNSYSHGWSAAPTYLMQAYILGVRPIEPGFRRFLVKPWLADLKWCEGSVPTPHGAIRLSWKRSAGDGIEGTIHVPEGCEAEFDSGTRSIRLGPGRHEVKAPDLG
jgi:hypothetical protein